MERPEYQAEADSAKTATMRRLMMAASAREADRGSEDAAPERR